MISDTVRDIGPDYQLTPSPCFCEEKYRLLDDFLSAVRELNRLQTQQTQAVIRGDRDFTRFDILMYGAQERKNVAKYAWIEHVENHHCEDIYGVEQSRT
jgi:hypothetical protein